MITHFAVKNFRNFKGWTNYSLSSDKKYVFNESAVPNNIVQHAMLYGENGSGKTNLGYAILDITRHLSQAPTRYPNFVSTYLNADSADELAEFKFTFSFDGNEVFYQYGKDKSSSIVYESLHIQGEEILHWDRRKSNLAVINLLGAETLTRELSENVASVVTFVLNNASLQDSPQKALFFALLKFVEGMVFFKAMSSVNEYAGVAPTKHENISAQIIEEFGIFKLEYFLSQCGIAVKLGTYSGDEGERISQVLAHKSLDFFSVASSGTFSLVILFVWLQKMQKGQVSFAYIDEFDAFYHHKLAKDIVKQISSLPAQTILSSHNTSVMSNNLLRPDCYFEIKNQAVTPLYKLSDRELRKAHNLEKMYRSGAFDE